MERRRWREIARDADRNGVNWWEEMGKKGVDMEEGSDRRGDGWVERNKGEREMASKGENWWKRLGGS